MRLKMLTTIFAVAALSGPTMLMADDPTPAALQSQVQTHLRLNIGDKVKEVHFVNTNADNDVFTRAYVLKHVDPYEIRPYVLAAIGGIPGSEVARRINGNATKVECIKYMDGTSLLIVSAEDYRFEKDGNENGMSIDEIIAALDKPNNIAERGDIMRLYFPQNRTAAEIAVNLRRVGITVSGRPASVNWELDEGASHARVDRELNALVLYHPHYAGKQIDVMLGQYDRPNPEVRIKYTVYEYDDEADAMVGSDFQAWKNGPGTDFFSTGIRLTQGWDVANMNVASADGIGANTAKLLNFNPKWNTKYLDFLATKGLAKIVTSGSTSLYTDKVGIVESTVSFPVIRDGVVRGATGVTAVTTTGEIATDGTTGAGSSSGLRLAHAVSRSNEPIDPTVFGNGVAAVFQFWAYEVTSYNGNGKKVVDYFYEINSDKPVITAKGQSLGSHVIITSSVPQGQVELSQWDPSADSGNGGYVAVDQAASLTEPTAFAVSNAPTRISSVVSLGDKNDRYGFTLRFGANREQTGITVCADATTLPIEMSNSSLVGFSSTGSPRTTVSEFATVLQVNNKGDRFVVGGIEKQQRLRSAAKVPFLGDIPLLGWLLGNERETFKKSHLVAMLEVTPVNPVSAVPIEAARQIGEIKKDLAEEKLTYGYDQIGLDGNKKGFSSSP